MRPILAVIPARGGSKRIPRKNIKDFLGKPIIAHSIDAALRAGCFSETMVSTEDEEIAAIAKSYGASIPFYRSPALADDHTSTDEVLYEVVAEYEKRGRRFDYACCIYPTAPFVTPDILLSSLHMIETTGASSVVPVTRTSAPIGRALEIVGGRLQWIFPQHARARSQDLPDTFFDCGQFYWVTVESFLENKSVINNDTVPIVLPWNRVQDIDTVEDWNSAECKYRLLYPHSDDL